MTQSCGSCVSVCGDSTAPDAVTLTLAIDKNGNLPNVIEFIEGAAWLVEGVLNSAECDALILECQQHHADVQYGLSYCTKSCFDDSVMAEFVQEKIKNSFLLSSAPSTVIPSNEPVGNTEALEFDCDEFAKFTTMRKSSSTDTKSELIPKDCVSKCSLIEQLRYIEYPSGGYIGPHTDGIRVCPVSLRQTNMTMIIYLQDSITGETKFLNGSKSDYQSICSIKPRKGNMLLFRHQLLHMGDGVGNEGKILLRGDIVVPIDDCT